MNSTQGTDSKCPSTSYILIIPSITGDHVLATVLPTQLLQLPMIRYPPEGGLEREVVAQFGIRVHVVRFWSGMLYDFWPSFRCHWTGNDADSRGTGLIVMDILDDYPKLREPLQWISRDRALDEKWIHRMRGFDVVDLIAQCFGEKNGEVHWKESQPWWSAGWFTNISRWIDGVLDSRNMVQERDTLQMHYGGENTMTMILKCEVRRKCEEGSLLKESREILYTKSSFPVLREGQRTASIWRVIGDIAAEVLGVYEGDGTILTRDAGEISKDDFDEEALLKTIVEMQRKSMDRIEELEAGGLMVMDSEWVMSNVRWILYHEAVEDVWKGKDRNGMNELYKEMVEELRSEVVWIEETCRRVGEYKLPKTIVHGDLGFHNIGSRGKGNAEMYRFFDWGSAFIGNPVYDFHKVANSGDAFAGILVNKDNVITHFRKEWMSDATHGEIISLLEMTEVMYGVLQVYELVRNYRSYDSLYAINPRELMGDVLGELSESVAGVKEYIL